jgi:hypothetical protein
MKYLIGRPNMRMAGERFVFLSGVFLYCSMARWKESLSMSTEELVLSIRRRLAVLTPISALQLLWGKATEDNL